MALTPRIVLEEVTLEHVSCLLGGLLLVDLLQWDSDAGRQLPGLLDSGMRYQREPDDVWRDLFSTYEHGGFDCEDASTIYAAQGRVRRDHPFVFVYVVRVTPKLIHVYNGDGRGNYIDISALRGMAIPDGVDLDALHKRGLRCPI
ncbi:MAG TPA: hypothetical protein VLS89_14840 [Candidatus Nanopelagicales bacterium]|nr:hypothetical protein [Candidatus Nanopelagicales bacterium]